MIVEKITVTAARARPHPHEQFSTLRPEITLEARLEPGDDYEVCAAGLLARAERMVHDHTNLLVLQLRKIHRLEKQRDQVLIDVERVVAEATVALHAARAKAPQATTFPETKIPGDEAQHVEKKGA